MPNITIIIKISGTINRLQTTVISNPTEVANNDRLMVTFEAKNNDSGKSVSTRRECSISVPTHLIDEDRQWRTAYHSYLGGVQKKVMAQAPPVEIEGCIRDSQACQKNGDRLISQFNQWINESRFETELQRVAHPDSYKENPCNFCFVLDINTGDGELDLFLKRLPFHTLEFFRNEYPQAEMNLGTNPQPSSPQSANQNLQVLVVRGYDPGINLLAVAARHSFKNPNNLKLLCLYLNAWILSVENVYLVISQKLENLPEVDYWDSGAEEDAVTSLFNKLTNSSPQVLFFIGHSESTNGVIRILINNRESIDLKNGRFRNVLEGLISRGLAFAAFISCDGLLIGQELGNLGIPYLMVSREILPEHVAKELLDKFLEEATKPGVPIHIALNLVRDYLANNVETRSTILGCPNASNFPVIFQAPEQHSYILIPNSVGGEISNFVPVEVKEVVSPPPPPPPDKSWWQNRSLRRFGMFFSVIILVGMASIFIHQLFDQNLVTACDDIRRTNPNLEYISCGEKTLLKYPTLNPDQKKLYETAKKELEKASPDYSMVVKNLKKLKNYPEISVAYYNAKSKENLKKGVKQIKTIAVMLPLSDYIKNKESDLPNSILTAVAQAQAQWNSDNDNEWNVEVLLVNDFNDPNNTSPVKFITQQSKILGAISNYNSSLTKAFASLYKNKLTVVSATNTATNLTKIIPNYFRITVSTDIQAENIINFIFAKGIRKVAIFSQKGPSSSETVFANSFEQSIIKAGQNKSHPIKILKSDLFHLSENMISNTEASKIKNKGYEAVIINSNSFTNSNLPGKILDFISEITEKAPECLIIGNEVVADSILVESVKSEGIKTDKLLISLPWSETSLTTQNTTNRDGKNFDASKLGDIPIRHRAFLTYDAIYVLLDAINKGFIQNRNDAQIKAELPTLIRNMTKEDQKYFGVTGSITIPDEGSDRTQHLYGLVKVEFDNKTKAPKFVKAQ
jgi:ABC-type branched-subunit amino acid transport system substrate-binding protein